MWLSNTEWPTEDFREWEILQGLSNVKNKTKIKQQQLKKTLFLKYKRTIFPDNQDL